MRKRYVQAIKSAVVLTSVVWLLPLCSVQAEQQEIETADSVDPTEEGGPVSFDLSSDFLTDYIFRGQNLFDGTSIQPSGTGAFSLGEAGSLSANIWAHLSAEGGSRSKEEKFTEIDYTLGYEVSLGMIGLGVGHIWYTFPDGGDAIANTEEFYASIAVDTVLSPSLTVYKDYDEFDSVYYALGFGHDIECEKLGEGFAVSPSLTFGFASNADKVYADNSGLMHVTAGLGMEFPLGVFTVSPSFNYNFEVDDSTSNEFFVGVGVGTSL